MSETKLFAAVLTYGPNIVERRAPYREAHLAHLRNLHAAGKVVLAGAWNNPIDGGLIVFRAGSQEEVEALLREDPYAKAGLFEDVRVREWNVVIGSV